jgi:hypothetical protein
MIGVELDHMRPDQVGEVVVVSVLRDTVELGPIKVQDRGNGDRPADRDITLAEGAPADSRDRRRPDVERVDANGL